MKKDTMMEILKDSKFLSYFINYIALCMNFYNKKFWFIINSVYDDVPKCFLKWTENGQKIYIYSSGSIQAQKLLFANSEHGDLLKFISGHFDTSVGLKQEKLSYVKIIENINFPASDIVFLTDIVKGKKNLKFFLKIII